MINLSLKRFILSLFIFSSSFLFAQTNPLSIEDVFQNAIKDSLSNGDRSTLGYVFSHCLEMVDEFDRKDLCSKLNFINLTFDSQDGSVKISALCMCLLIEDIEKTTKINSSIHKGSAGCLYHRDLWEEDLIKWNSFSGCEVFSDSLRTPCIFKKKKK